MPNPLISLILCSRNDSYMGNSLWRLETSINLALINAKNANFLEKLEIVISDWGSEIPLSDVLNLVPEAEGKVKFIHIPPSVAIKEQKDAEIIIGGGYDKTKGYFIDPTVVVTTNPKFRTMCEEVFGPLITIYVYDEKNWIETLKLVDETSEYALTGAVFSVNRYAIDEATKILENAAGNFYINDKPTGAVVGQQPFGGGRGSGTNDKAGSILNLLRWVSPRTIKETFNPAKNYRYPFLEE